MLANDSYVATIISCNTKYCDCMHIAPLNITNSSNSGMYFIAQLVSYMHVVISSRCMHGIISYVPAAYLCNIFVLREISCEEIK